MSTAQPSLRTTSRLTIWLWVVFGVVLMLLATPFLVGSLLPAEAVGEVSATIDAPVDEVWAAALDYERFPVGAGLARSVRPLEDRAGQPAWIEELESTSWTVTTLEREPERRLAREVVDGAGVLDIHWELTLEPVGPGTRVKLVQRSTVRQGSPQLRFVLRFLGGAEMGPRAYVARLREALADGA